MKIPNNLKSASKLLLTFIIDNFGGFSEVGRMTGLERQTLHIATVKGYIALPTVHKVSKALNVDPWALSYVKLYEVFGEDSKCFYNVVEVSSLSKEQMEKVIKVYKKK